jgi:hypothetical protein
VFDNYARTKWKIKRVSWFRSQVFAYKYVIVPAANNKRGNALISGRRVRAKLRRVQRLWFSRAKELVVRGLWLPSPEYNSSLVQDANIKRCLYCRPTNVTFYWPGDTPNLQLCNRKHICPFCFAREAEEVYRRVSAAVQQLGALKLPARVTFRSQTYKLTARNFDPADSASFDGSDSADELRHLLIREYKKYEEIKPALKTETYGSFWRVIVNPVEDGWEIQIRQLFITRPKAKRPVNRAKKSAAIFLQSAPADDFKAVMQLLGQFVYYPNGLLLSYAELVAVFLHARKGIKLISGTGYLYAKIRKGQTKDEPPPLPFIP